ncbi:HSP20 family protein [Cryobacterium mesophilum]|uniref:Hsp20/alpha crystallin family protein n=1 Tax=Terrimesophilobacter mesophilus TaxID=433647 RepID=A0A4R8VBT5_9MICO|nr:Hsp20/alpha crystallin family protein [Terrimesophilobacter mesophilus]MBB5632844.1 HSP20 family protein [Terrimesophilobacter mesophilus]TFB80791.1 Hsp20/alpha crystallin family protein [Terrimesophilobacter mesophilus]
MALYFDPFRELDRVASNRLDSRRPRLMPIDLHKDGDLYVLNADLPGIDPGSVDVDVDGQLLTIRAERTARSEDVTWLAHERPSGSFLRRLNLGDGIDTEHISAAYDNGVLSVMIPVSEKAKPRKVAVQSGAASTPVEVAAA